MRADLLCGLEHGSGLVWASVSPFSSRIGVSSMTPREDIEELCDRHWAAEGLEF